MSIQGIMELLAQIKGNEKTPNRVPEGYFDQFSENMMARVRWEEELKIIAPLLLDIPRKPVYFAPEGYFEQFMVKPVQATAKVIKIPGWRKVVSYTAAAAIAGVLVTGAFYIPIINLPIVLMWLLIMPLMFQLKSINYRKMLSIST